MRFLCFFLFVVSAYGAEVDADVDASPLRVIMSSADQNVDSYGRNINGRRVYQIRDDQGSQHHIIVTYNTKNPRLGEFVAQDVEAQRSLSILMEFGGELNEPLCTKITYKDLSKTEEIVLTSWAEEEQDYGIFKVDAPAGTVHGCSGTTARRSIPIEEHHDRKGRPKNYGILKARFNDAFITQYPFRTANRYEGGFVQIWVNYFELNHVQFFFGTERYGGSEVHANEANTNATSHLFVDL